jgi:hypothetical protein
MDDALRMDNDLDPLISTPKASAPDHFQALVEQRRRIDGDLGPIVQVGCFNLVLA